MSDSFFNFSSNYKYIFDTYRQRALQMELALANGDFLESELDTIGDEMVEVAREFARVQGVFRKGNLINEPESTSIFVRLLLQYSSLEKYIIPCFSVK